MALWNELLVFECLYKLVSLLLRHTIDVPQEEILHWVRHTDLIIKHNYLLLDPTELNVGNHLEHSIVLHYLS